MRFRRPTRQIRMLRSVGAGDGRPPPATRWVFSNGHPYREPRRPEADIASQFAYAPTFFKRWTVGLPSMNSAIARPSVLKYSVPRWASTAA